MSISKELRSHPIYITWCGMKRRCNSSTCEEYKYYGGRGIKVCDEWNENFVPFFIWCIRNGWEPGLSIDRIDVNGNYEPDNCRWASVDVQQNNKRDNRYITYNGTTKTCAQWAKEIGLHRGTLGRRLDSGWTVEEALLVPSRKHKYNESKKESECNK